MAPVLWLDVRATDLGRRSLRSVRSCAHDRAKGDGVGHDHATGLSRRSLLAGAGALGAVDGDVDQPQADPEALSKLTNPQQQPTVWVIVSDRRSIVAGAPVRAQAYLKQTVRERARSARCKLHLRPICGSERN